MPPSTFFFVTFLLCLTTPETKVFGRCELARALRYNYGFPLDQLPTWVCIASYESLYDTSAFNRVSGDHGIFQISQLCWCSDDKHPGKNCNAACSKFRDDDIADDVACVKKIFAENERLSGDGFDGWMTYQSCSDNVGEFITGCF